MRDSSSTRGADALRPPAGRAPGPPLRETLRIVGVYVAVAALWIYFSDDLLARLTRDPDLIARLSTYKGWVFVAVTGVLLWGLVLRQLRRLETARDALAQSEERYRLMAENTGDVIWLLDLAGRRFTYVSPSVERLRGYTPAEVLEQPLEEVLTPASAELVGRVLPQRLAAFAAGDESQRTQTHEVDQTRRDGTTVPTEVVTTLLTDPAGRPTRILGVTRDITQRRHAERERQGLEARLHQAQKMESVGRLAGGVAHDFNNMLSVIAGRAELALLRGVPPGPLRSDLEEILKTSERSADLTRQLLAFARKQTVTPKVFELNEAVSGTLKMLQRLIGEDVTLVWKPGHGVGKIRIDPSQLDQILANLAVNARDAIAGRGTVTLETSVVAAGPARWSGHPDFRPEPYVLLSVTDTGAGMGQDVLEHLFEPFFTTKELGKGTGLGLATVFGIVRQNQGFIDVESERGRGSCFRVWLPQDAGPGAACGADARPPPPGGSETLLLVEDDDANLRVVRDTLQSAGYRVLAARGAREALGLAAEHSEPIHLLVSDVVMPEMNGRELWEEVRRRRPETRCLYMSGYPADVIATRGVLDEGVHLVEKPLRRDELLAAVRRVLDGG